MVSKTVNAKADNSLRPITQQSQQLVKTGHLLVKRQCVNWQMRKTGHPALRIVIATNSHSGLGKNDALNYNENNYQVRFVIGWLFWSSSATSVFSHWCLSAMVQP
jgi:hypothetical protein